MTLLAAPTEISLRRILFATDLSPGLNGALECAIGLSRRFGATVYTVNVVQAEITDNVHPPDPFYSLHCAENKLKNLGDSARFQGIEHHELVAEGVVSDVLPELIDRLGIDLIVLGTHARVGVKKLVLGSVAEQILRLVTCPVLTVGPEVPEELLEQAVFRQILYTTDLQPGSANALAYALWLAEKHNAHLTLLHEMPTAADAAQAYSESDKDRAINRLRKLLPSEQVPWSGTEFIVEAGVPATIILKLSGARKVDLIIGGARRTGYPEIWSHVPWFTAHQVLSHARCPVLTVRD